MNNLEYIHITKTGGTSIENWGYNNNILWSSRNIRYFNKFSHNQLNQKISKWHIPPSFFIKNPYNKKTFTCVRNPYTRIISEYYCSWSGSKNKNIKNKDEFNEWIQNLISKKNVVSGLPQYLYMPVDYILYFEFLQDDFTKLINNIDNSMCSLLGFSNRSRVLDINKFTIHDLYDETINQINLKYDKDFLLFNYEKIKV
jgi:hypothetical protein